MSELTTKNKIIVSINKAFDISLYFVYSWLVPFGLLCIGLFIAVACCKVIPNINLLDPTNKDILLGVIAYMGLFSGLICSIIGISLLCVDYYIRHNTKVI